MTSLRQSLSGWTDADVAAHRLAQCLGVFNCETSVADREWVYWSDNQLGTAVRPEATRQIPGSESASPSRNSLCPGLSRPARGEVEVPPT